MTTALKRLALIGGVLGASALLAYGALGVGSSGWFGHHGDVYHSAMWRFDGTDPEVRLAHLKRELQIRPPQEAAWVAFEKRYSAHVIATDRLHGSTVLFWSAAVQSKPDRGAVYQRSLTALRDSARALVVVLDEQQRAVVDKVFRTGPHRYFF